MIGKLLASDLMKAARGQTQIEGVDLLKKVTTTARAILVAIKSNFECTYRISLNNVPPLNIVPFFEKA